MSQVASVAAILAGEVAVGDEVTVRGWVRTRRDSKAGLSFVAVHDGSTFPALQVIAKADLPTYEAEISRLTTGCSVEVQGVVKASPAQGQDVELEATTFTVHGWVEEPLTYPLAPKRHSMEMLRAIPHLRPRTNTFGAVARVRHHLSQAIHSYFHDHGFSWVHTPILTTHDAEGAGEMFRASTLDLLHVPRTPDGKVDFSQDFFGKEAFLTVSGQLDVEGYCMALSKVYTFGPTFRAEASNTSRHLAEFWMVEPEIAFADLGDLIDLTEDFLKTTFATVLDRCAPDLEFFAKHVELDALRRVEALIATPFARIPYTEAVGILQRSGRSFEFPVSWGIDLQSEHERYLTEEHVKGPVVVTDYPKDIKAFYMRRNPDGRTVAAMDVLAPGIGEIVGGSQREERLDHLLTSMAASGIDPEIYAFYLDLRRYGTVPHAGFGLGLDRALVYLTGMKNIRDVIPYPRANGLAV